jgi:sulfatase modifying factor 1
VILLLVILQSALAQMPYRITTPSGYPMRRIPAGTFTMGCTPEQELSLNDVRESPDCEENEKPAHTVNITFPFFMGEVEVTRGVYRDVAGGAPETWACTSNDCPAVMVSWNDAVALANEMSLKEGLKPCYTIHDENVSWPEGLLCEGYRLPTEAEWEHAARAGDGFKYPGSNDPDQVAWYESNSGGDAHRVGGKAPNSWGIYDMSGNVGELVWGGWWDYSEGRATDPIGTLNEYRVLRGGGWGSPASYLRIPNRGVGQPGKRYSDVGFRIVRTDPAHLAAIAAAAEQDELAKQVLLADVDAGEVDNNSLNTEKSVFDALWRAALFALGMIILCIVLGRKSKSPPTSPNSPTPSISIISTRNHLIVSRPAGVKVRVPVGFIIPAKMGGEARNYVKRTETGYVWVKVIEEDRVHLDDKTLLRVDDAVIDCFFTDHRG